MNRFKKILNMKKGIPSEPDRLLCYSIDDFWKIIDAVQLFYKNENDHVQKLVKILTETTNTEIIKFHDFFFDFQYPHIDRKILQDAFLKLNKNVSIVNEKNGYHSFHAWLIGQGKKIYTSAKNDPTFLAQYLLNTGSLKSTNLYSKEIPITAVLLPENAGLAFAATYAFRKNNPGQDLPSPLQRQYSSLRETLINL